MKKTLTRVAAGIAALAAAAAAQPATASDQTGSHLARTTLELDVVGAFNPDGLMATFAAYRRWMLEGQDTPRPSPYLQAGAAVSASPAYARGTIQGEWMPHAAIQVNAQYGLYRYFGANKALFSFDSGDAAFGDGELDDREGTEETAWGQRLLLRPVLRAQFGSILLRNQTDLAWFRFDGRGPYFLEWEYDTLLKDGDWLVADTIQALVRAWTGTRAAALYAGPFFEISRAGASGIVQERAGIAVFWTVADRVGRLSRPRVYAQVGMHLRDPNREDEAYLLAGFGCDLDFGR